MKALLITIGYLPYTFSEALCNAKLVYALQQKGWEVDVISRIDDGTTYCREWQEPWLCLKPNLHEINYPVGNKVSRTLDLIRSTIQMEGYPLAGIRWARRAYQKAVALHKEKHYDVVLTRSPSDIPHIIGFKLKKRFSVRWVANWNDPSATIWPEPYTHHFSSLKKKMLQSYTVKCLRNADINTFPSRSLLDHFIENFPFIQQLHTEIIPHIALSESLYTPTKREKKEIFRLCHSGNLSTERNPELLFSAMREMINEGYTNIQLDIMGYINEYTSQLIDKYNLTEHVKCAGSYPYMEAIHLLQEYDALVLLEAMMKHGIFFASKFTDYAQSGSPILAVSPPKGFAQNILSQYGGGIAVNNGDIQDIKRGLVLLYKHWETGGIDKEFSTHKLYSQFAANTVVDIYNQLLK